MSITIIGASAGIGLLTVEQALAWGHQVTAFSRDTSLIPDHAALTKVNGSATSVADLKMVVAGADAVLVTIGNKTKKAQPYLPTQLRHLLTRTPKQNRRPPSWSSRVSGRTKAGLFWGCL